MLKYSNHLTPAAEQHAQKKTSFISVRCHQQLRRLNHRPHTETTGSAHLHINEIRVSGKQITTDERTPNLTNLIHHITNNNQLLRIRRQVSSTETDNVP